MKKFLSILLAVLVITASCTCAFSALSEENLNALCAKGHNVLTWTKVNAKSHVGTCTICGKEIKAAHNLTKMTGEGDTVAPTCKDRGYTKYQCICQVEKDSTRTPYITYSDYVAALGCDVIEAYYDYATLGAENKYTITTTCRNSATPHVETRTLGAANYCPRCESYTLKSKKVVAPTCDALGYTDYHCVNAESDCGEYRGDDYVSAVPHKYRSEKVAPTCTTEGYTRNICIYCKGEYQSQLLPATGHAMDKAGESYTYNYSGGTCQIIGICSECNLSQMVTYDSAVETCGKCNSNVTKKIVTMPANCDDPIMVTIHCSNTATCGIHIISALPVGHQPLTTTYSYNPDGTCDVTVDCKVCGINTSEEDEYINDNECVICGSLLEKRVVTASDCTTGGFSKVYCGECGAYTDETFSATGHKPAVVEWNYDHVTKVAVSKATCYNKGCEGYTNEIVLGSITAVCSRCSKNTLTYKKIVNTTCTIGGYKSAECSYCGSRTKYDVTSPKEHTYITSVVEPTCTDNGSSVKTCVECYRTTETDIVPALGHIGNVTSISYYTDGYKNTKYRCQREGCTSPDYNKVEETTAGERKCSNCGANNGVVSKTIVAPVCKANGETFNGYTRLVCDSCRAVDIVTDIVTATHDFTSWKTITAATCLASGERERTCNACGYVQRQVIPQNVDSDGNPKHNFVILVPAVEATCTEKGKTAELYCQVCKSFQKSYETPALGHVFDPYSTNPNFCSRCDSYVIDAAGEAVVCSCICHNEDGLAQFVFKFLCFFFQILGIMQTCDCGTVHY